mmetsp:Transcript_23888/g.61036  ORF Transcript_23888/g.61036 Transcript_23888/m.61036 type:complete len:381 (-) Transcript_23888:142-1284(-)
MASTRTPSACAVDGTVVGTVASASYAAGMHNLAASAHKVGFACIVVMPFDWFSDLHHDLIVPLPVASPSLRPRQMWCRPPYKDQYGWRRSQLYRARLWREVLALNLNLLAMDLDHQLGSVSPLPFIRAVYAPSEPEGHVQKTGLEATRRPGVADIVAVWDGPAGRYLNVGIMWIRSTPTTRALAVRCENRSFSGWEQEIFNEEINYNMELQDARCCHSSCFKRLFETSKVVKSLPAKSGRGSSARLQAEGRDRCSDDQPYAVYPPRGSPEPWVKKWMPFNDTLRSKHFSNRKYGRCNIASNVCTMLNGTGHAVDLKHDGTCSLTYRLSYSTSVWPSALEPISQAASNDSVPGDTVVTIPVAQVAHKKGSMEIIATFVDEQ